MVSARKGVANLGTTKRNYVCRVFFSISHFLQLFSPALIHSSIPLLLAVTGHMRTRFVGSLVLGNWLMTKLRHVRRNITKGSTYHTSRPRWPAPHLPCPDQQLLCQISADFNWDFKETATRTLPPSWSLTPAHWVQSVSVLCCAVLQNHPLNLRIISQCWLIPLSTLPSSPSPCLLKSSWQYGD